jgi:hypothetical protein
VQGLTQMAHQSQIGPFLPAKIPSLDVNAVLSALLRRFFAMPMLQEIHLPEQLLLLAPGHESLGPVSPALSR